MKNCHKVEDIRESHKPVHKIQANIKAAKINWVTLLGGVPSIINSTETKTAYSLGIETPQGYPEWRLRKELNDAMVGVDGVTIFSLEPNQNYAGLWRVVFMYDDEKVFSRKVA